MLQAPAGFSTRDSGSPWSQKEDISVSFVSCEASMTCALSELLSVEPAMQTIKFTGKNFDL